MATIQLSGFGRRMQQLISWSGQVNDALGPAKPSDEVARMSRLSLWLTMTFAFDGLVQGASRALGTEAGFRAKKDAESHEPDVLIRLNLLSEERGLDLSLPDPLGPPSPRMGADVIRRHFRLRNKWAHSLGVFTVGDPLVSPIAAWDGPDEQAWITEAGWSELRTAVEALSQRILKLDAGTEGPPVRRGALVVTAKLRLPTPGGLAFDVRPQHTMVLTDIAPRVIEFCRDMIAFWHVSRHAYPLFRCSGDQLVGEPLNEVWLQCSPAEGRTFELITGMKRAIEDACSALGIDGVRARIQIADERTVFDDQLAEIGGIQNIPRLWSQAQQASERALQDIRKRQRREPDPDWYAWATHIYRNVVSARVT